MFSKNALPKLLLISQPLIWFLMAVIDVVLWHILRYELREGWIVGWRAESCG